MANQRNNGLATWKDRNSIFVKTVSNLLLLTFLCFDITWAQGGALLWQNAKPADVNVSVKNQAGINSISIPSADGKINYANLNGGKTIINIQDAHTSLTAQASIVNILDSLVTNYDLSLIAVEGSEGYIDTSILRTFPDKEIRKNTASHLMEKGRMSAGEFFTIVSEKPVALYGIENNDLYKENVESFKSVIADKALCLKNVEALDAELKNLEAKIYGKELKGLVHESALHKEGALSFSKYWEKLSALAKVKGVDLGGYDNIAKLLTTITLEKEIDFDKANRERTSLIDQLGKVLPKEEMESLVIRSVSFKKGELTQAEFHNYLIELAEKSKLDPAAYKNLIGFARYVAIYDTIDIFKLYSEVDLLEKTLRDKLYVSDDERSLYDLQKKAGILKDLFNVNLTNDGAEYLLSHKNEFKAVDMAAYIRKSCQKYGITIEGGYDLPYIIGRLDEAVKFYNIVHRRNDAIIKNTIKNMNAEKQSVAALITGGFHSKGLADLVKAKGLSYLIIMPKFKQGKDRPYIAVLTNKRDQYEGLIKSGQYELAVHQFFSIENNFDRAATMAIALGGIYNRESKNGPEAANKAMISAIWKWAEAYHKAYNLPQYREDNLAAKRPEPGDFKVIAFKLAAAISEGKLGDTDYEVLKDNPVIASIVNTVLAAPVQAREALTTVKEEVRKPVLPKLDTTRPIRIAINNPGVQEREIIRQYFEGNLKGIEIVGVNGISPDNLNYVLTKDVSASTAFREWYQDNYRPMAAGLEEIYPDGRTKSLLPVTEIIDPKDFSWEKLDADVVIEGSNPNLLKTHIDKGAKRVIFSHPALTASSALMTAVSVLPEKDITGIRFTDTQPPSPLQRGLDNSNPNPVLARAMRLNIAPAFAKDIKISLNMLSPKLAKKTSGIVAFTPQASGSLLDVQIVFSKDVDVATINKLFKAACEEGALKGKMTYSKDKSLVSSDLAQNSEFIFLSTNTKVTNKRMVHLNIMHNENTAFAVTQLPEIIKGWTEGNLTDSIITSKTPDSINADADVVLNWATSQKQDLSILDTNLEYIPTTGRFTRPRLSMDGKNVKAVVGLNGPGRTGRTITWAMQGNPNIDLRMINGASITLGLSWLLTEDSIQQNTPKPVTRVIVTPAQLKKEVKVFLQDYDIEGTRGLLEGLITSGKLVILDEAKEFTATLEKILKDWGSKDTSRDIQLLKKSLVGILDLNGKKVLMVNERRAVSELPWDAVGVKVILESTGDLKDATEAGQHLTYIKGGKVIITAPAEGVGQKVVLGVVTPSPARIVDNASCTTNCLVPVTHVLDKEFELESQEMLTVHSYTTDQTYADHKPHKKELGRGRDGGQNVLFGGTGAAQTAGEVMPAVSGRSDGWAERVPTPTGSFVSLTAVLRGKVTREEVQAALKRASETYLKGILAYTQAPLTSTSIIGNPASSIVDGNSVEIVNDYDAARKETVVGLITWYDNETGFSNRMVDHAVYSAASMMTAKKIIGDIGDKTIEEFSGLIATASTIFWNGPMGVTEVSSTAKGTEKIAQAIANQPDATKIVGGGDTLVSVDEETRKKMSHVSTGGGALLEAIQLGVENLPGNKALIDPATGEFATLDALLAKLKEGDTVLIRMDLNVPLDSKQNITDNTRIRESLQTIVDIMRAKKVKLVLMTHLGRPNGIVVPELRVDPIARELQKLLPGMKVHKLDDCIGEPIKKFIRETQQSGEIVLLENTRFRLDEEQNKEAFSKELSELADYYVNEAFSVNHRAHASNVGVAEFFAFGKKFAGRLLEKEYIYLKELGQNPKKPFIGVLAGGKVSSKMPIINAIKDKVDLLLIGGKMSVAFLAAKGVKVGDSAPDEQDVSLARKLLQDPALKGKIILPKDNVVVSNISTGEDAVNIEGDVEPSDMSKFDEDFAGYLASYAVQETVEGMAKEAAMLMSKAVGKAQFGETGKAISPENTFSNLALANVVPSQVECMGSPTVRVDTELHGGAKGYFVIPAGTSTGGDEAKTVGVEQAFKNITLIHKEVVSAGLKPDQLSEIGQLMLKMGKDTLGAEATLSYQMALAGALANQKDVGLYELLRELFPDIASEGVPETVVQYNITNGGQHATNELDMQEFMIVTRGRTVAESNKMCDQVDEQLGLIYQKLGLDADPYDKGVGDKRGKEGGYRIGDLTREKLKDIYAHPENYNIGNLDIRALGDMNTGIHEFVLNCMIAAIKNAGYAPSTSGEVGTVSLALDLAASSMLVEGTIDRYNYEGTQISSKELADLLAYWSGIYPISSIEDGMAEDDWQGWMYHIETVGDKVLLTGDDNLVTQGERVMKLINLLKEKGFIDPVTGKVTKKIGILIKLNQNGFLTTGIDNPEDGYLGTVEVMRLAKQYGIKLTISHRSKEAEAVEKEVSIAHVAAFVNAYALKSGDHVQATRAVKEDELAAIEEREIEKAITTTLERGPGVGTTENGPVHEAALAAHHLLSMPDTDIAYIQKVAQELVDALRSYSEKSTPEEYIDVRTMKFIISILDGTRKPEYVPIIAVLTQYSDQIDQTNLPGALKEALLATESETGLNLTTSSGDEEMEKLERKQMVLGQLSRGQDNIAGMGAKAAVLEAPTSHDPILSESPLGAISTGKIREGVSRQAMLVYVPESMMEGFRGRYDKQKEKLLELAIKEINESETLAETVKAVYYRSTGDDIADMKLVETLTKSRGASVGIPVRSGISLNDLLKELKSGLLSEISRDISAVTDNINIESVRKMTGAERLTAIQNIVAGFKKITSKGLSELSIYNMIMTRTSNQTSSEYLSTEILLKATDNENALSMRADTVGEMKLLAEEHRQKMRLAGSLDSKALPIKLEVRLTVNEKSAVNKDNIKDILERMGISDVLSPEDVTLVDRSAADTAVKDAYDRLAAKGYRPEEIAIVDRAMENRQDVPEGVIFAEYTDDLVTASTYDAAIELLALSTRSDELKLSVFDTQKRWFAITPITRIDFDQLRRDIEQYEKVLIAA